MAILKTLRGHQLLNKKTEQILRINNDDLHYLLIRSKKRKRSLAMKIQKDGQLQLNVPYLTSIFDIESFIQSKYNWIKEKQLYKPKEVKEKTYSDGELHKYQGEEFPLKLVIAKSNNVELSNGFIVIYFRHTSSIKLLLKNWYRVQALNFLANRTKLFANNYNLPNINAIKVRYMRARWGSCNSRAEITYNIHLIKKSPECIDYVIIHELCHLIHPNHGKGFYRLQTKLNPYWKNHKERLNS